LVRDIYIAGRSFSASNDQNAAGAIWAAATFASSRHQANRARDRRTLLLLARDIVRIYAGSFDSERGLAVSFLPDDRVAMLATRSATRFAFGSRSNRALGHIRIATLADGLFQSVLVQMAFRQGASTPRPLWRRDYASRGLRIRKSGDHRRPGLGHLSRGLWRGTWVSRQQGLWVCGPIFATAWRWVAQARQKPGRKLDGIAGQRAPHCLIEDIKSNEPTVSWSTNFSDHWSNWPAEQSGPRRVVARGLSWDNHQ